MDDPLLNILNKFSGVFPLTPNIITKRTTVSVVADPCDQSRLSSDPVPAAPVRDVGVLLMSASVPVVNVFAAPVDIWKSFPVVKELEFIYSPVPDVSELPVNTKALVVVVPLATDDANVWLPVPAVTFTAAAPPEFPIDVTIPDPFPIVVVLFDVNVVKDPARALDFPMVPVKTLEVDASVTAFEYVPESPGLCNTP